MSKPTRKVYNFASGPSKVPEEVMLQIQKEILNFDDTQISVMELSHRSPNFEKVVKGAEEDLRKILNIPSNYKVLFLQGGGNGQFAAVPLNLCTKLNEPVDYIVSGLWSEKAAKEAEKYCRVNRISNLNKNYTSLPELAGRINPEARYVYYCSNETVHGIEFSGLPNVQLGPEQVLVADMSSNFLTRPVDVSKFGVIYAGAQKNAGISGVTVVIVRDDLLERANPLTPTVLEYKTMAAHNSLYNTPPCFAIYVTRLCLAWIRANGGIAEMERRSIKKSSLVYDLIEASKGFYTSTVRPDSRSRVNIPFRINNGDAALEKQFLAEAEARGMIQLKGHRNVGGIRAGLFNAITLQEASDLADFLREFQAKYDKK